MQDVEARQWEDPLAAVAAAYDDGRRSHHDTVDAARRHSPDALRRQIASETEHGNRVLIVASIVPGAPYPNDVESRRRTRYAVLAGLFGAQFVPDSNEHIGYMMLPGLGDDPLQSYDVSAYEWFDREGGGDADHSRVLLLWMDQDWFRTQPLNRFSKLVTMMTKGVTPEKVSTVMLGPADSDGLRAMTAEVTASPAGSCAFLEASQRDIHIYSDSATASDEWLLGDVSSTPLTVGPNGGLAGVLRARCDKVHLYRTIATDQSVVQEVFKELKFRGIHDSGEIALVTERDTLYARMMSRYFNGCADAPELKQAGPGLNGNIPGTRPRCFTYLRGLDGLSPPTSVSTSSGTKRDGEKSTRKGSDTSTDSEEPSFGQGQFDYLRRLVSTLTTAVDCNDCRPINAIGVLGGDIYDKVLVLQALRNAFPRVVFFTTDLDARLTDEENLKWTRELIVGSPLGLTLQPEIQGSVPPFRDSYQSAAFYSAREAARAFVHAAKAGQDTDANAPASAAEGPEITWAQHPHVFEIGRRTAYDLTDDRQTRSTPGTPFIPIAARRRPPTWSVHSVGGDLCAALMASLAAVLGLHVAKGSRWLTSLVRRDAGGLESGETFNHARIAALVVIFAVSIVMAWDWLIGHLSDQGRIPTPLFGGAGRWPATCVELVSIFLVVALIARAQRKLNENAEEIREEFKLQPTLQELQEAHAAELKQLPVLEQFQEHMWVPFGRLPAKPSRRLMRLRVTGLQAYVSHYLYRGRWRARAARAGVLTILATAALIALEYLLIKLQFSLGTSLVNNFALADFYSVDKRLEGLISLLNLLAMQFIVFWVADALLLTRAFALGLAHDGPTWPASSAIHEPAMRRLPGNCATAHLNLRLIATRTSCVSHFVWYPSGIIALMALAAITVQFGEFGFANNLVALAISAASVLGAGVLLRRSVEWWRKRELDKIEALKMAELGLNPSRAWRLAQLDHLSEATRKLNKGAFAPYSQQPLVQAVLIPLLTYAATMGVPWLRALTP